jgi:enediyne biosynthesis protein E4
MHEGLKGFIRKWFWFGCGAVGLGTIIIAILSSGWLGFRLFQLEWKPQGQTELAFRKVALDFVNETDPSGKAGSLPFMAGVVIDIDQDGRDEIVLGGGRDQQDGVFGFDNELGRFVDLADGHDIIKPAGDATMGGVSVDLDFDGWPELLLARESGLWIHANQGGQLAAGELVFTPPEGDRTTILSIAPGDIDRDGLTDLYLSGYIRNEDVEGQAIFTRPYGGYSYLLTGQEDGSFVDETEKWGLRRQHNTFVALFADFDDDRDSDLIVAQDTGRIETWRNDGAPPLVAIDNPSVSSYPMGLAAGDFNGDLALDFYASNVGHTLPEMMLRGDLPGDAPFNPDYMLFAGDGADGFSDIARDMDAARIGFGWGVIAADFNLDGWEDIAIAQNYAKFGQPAIIHRYAGKILQNYAGEEFRPVEKRTGAGNRHFAISPLMGDFNGDQRPDLVWANLTGPARAFINETPDTRAITLRFDDSVRAYGARIEISTGQTTIMRQVVPAQGLASDQSATLFIGLGSRPGNSRIRIVRTDGRVETHDDVEAGSVIDLREVRP